MLSPYFHLDVFAANFLLMAISLYASLIIGLYLTDTFYLKSF